MEFSGVAGFGQETKTLDLIGGEVREPFWWGSFLKLFSVLLLVLFEVQEITEIRNHTIHKGHNDRNANMTE